MAEQDEKKDNANDNPRIVPITLDQAPQMIHSFLATTCGDLPSHPVTCLKDQCSLKAHLTRGTSRVPQTYKTTQQRTKQWRYRDRQHPGI